MNLNPCGASCDRCPSYLGTDELGRTCPGCLEANGNPWWGVCNVFRCSKNKDLQHCGLCDQFPCDRLIAHYDPDNPQGQRNAVLRVGILAYRARHGDEKVTGLVMKLRALESE
jgi:hypothetical protein